MGISHFEIHFSKDWAPEAILQINYEISGRFLCFQKILLVGKHNPEQNWVAIKIRSWFMQPNFAMLTGSDEVGAC